MSTTIETSHQILLLLSSNALTVRLDDEYYTIYHDYEACATIHVTWHTLHIMCEVY